MIRYVETWDDSSVTLYKLSISEYSDLSYILFTVCGKNRLKPILTTEMLQMINENQVAPGESGLCSSVLISDRFALTAAHCWEEFSKV